MEHQSHENAILTASIEELDTSTFPSPSQRAASAILQEFSDEQVQAWLSLLRSLQPGYQHFASSRILSSQHIHALSILKDFPDSLVLSWLRTSRSPSQSYVAQRLDQNKADSRLQRRTMILMHHMPMIVSTSCQVQLHRTQRDTLSIRFHNPLAVL